MIGNAPANFLDLTAGTRSFDAIAAIREETFELSGEREPAHLDGAHVTTQFFDVFGVTPILGRTFRRGDDVRGGEGRVVLSHEAWQGQFAGSDPNIVGRVDSLERTAYSVSAVMPAGFRYRQDLRVWALATEGMPPSPIEVDGTLAEKREVRYFDVVGRLKADDHARGCTNPTPAPSPEEIARANIHRRRKGSTTGCGRCTTSQSATSDLRCLFSWPRSDWSSSSPAPTSPVCSSRARRRDSAKWRCARRSGPAACELPDCS